MKDRIKQIMDNENMTPTKFADRLQVNRAVISHIINGRNNPSLDVVMSILTEMPYISSDWLLNNKGNMYKEGFSLSNIQRLPNEANEDKEFMGKTIGVQENVPESALEEALSPLNMVGTKFISKEKLVAKKISQIIIYYEDNTFETFVINK